MRGNWWKGSRESEGKCVQMRDGKVGKVRENERRENRRSDGQ